MDHWWANLRLMASQPALTRWLTGYEEVRSIGPGEAQPLHSGTVSVFPLGEGPWKISSSGLRWPLDGLDFHTWHSLSNEVAKEGAMVRVSVGRFLILRPWAQGDNREFSF
jgi:thiamine pyrophosphokinase